MLFWLALSLLLLLLVLSVALFVTQLALDRTLQSVALLEASGQPLWVVALAL